MRHFRRMTSKPRQTRQGPRRWLWLFLSVAPLGALAAPALKPYAGEQATFVLPTLAGEPYALAKHRGEAVLVNFWATWCPPCVKEMPSLERLAERLAGEPFALVTINLGETPDVVAAFVEAHDLELTVLIDADGAASRNWGVFAYPSTFLVDPDGRITHVRYGEAEWNDPAIVSMIESVLP